VSCRSDWLLARAGVSLQSFCLSFAMSSQPTLSAPRPWPSERPGTPSRCYNNKSEEFSRPAVDLLSACSVRKMILCSAFMLFRLQGVSNCKPQNSLSPTSQSNTSITSTSSILLLFLHQPDTGILRLIIYESMNLQPSLLNRFLHNLLPLQPLHLSQHIYLF